MFSRGERCRITEAISMDSMPIGVDRGFPQQVLKVDRG